MAIPRILHVTTTMGYAGVAGMLWRYYRHLDRERYQFDFVSHGPAEEYHRDIRALGGHVFYADTLGTVGLRRYLARLRTIIRDHGPYFAVHAHTNYQAGFVGLAAALERVPVRICHVRGIYVNERNRPLLPLYRLLIRWTCNARFACSRQAGRYYFGHQPFDVIANAVDLSAFQPTGATRASLREQFGVAGYGLVLGHIGRFSVEKNHDFLLAAVAELRRRGHDAALVLVGDGPLGGSIAARCEALGLEEHTHFLGVRKDIPAILQAVDAVLLPSFSEGMPNVIIEAQAAGVPCLLADTITREVDLGLNLVHFAPTTSPALWADALTDVCRTPRPTLAAAHAAVRAAGFDLGSGVVHLMSLYDGLAARGAAGAGRPPATACSAAARPPL